MVVLWSHRRRRHTGAVSRGVRSRDGVVYTRDDLHQVVEGTLLLCGVLPVVKTANFGKLQAQLWVLCEEVWIPVAEVLQRLLQRKGCSVEGARAADPPFCWDGLEEICKSQCSFSH